MFFTGDIVLYEANPYVFLELDSQQGIYALVRAKYTERGWVYQIESKKDILTDIDTSQCDELRNSGIALDDLCTEVGKYYERSAIQQGVAVQLAGIVQDCKDTEAKMFTCNLNELTKVRKQWRKNEIEKVKIQAKLDKEDKALDTKLKGIAKEFDDEILYTSQQIPTDFDTGTTVRIFGDTSYKDYVAIYPTLHNTFGYLYDPDSKTVSVLDKGRFYETTNQIGLDRSLQAELVQYVEELDKKVGIETQIEVYEKVLESNREAVKTEKDKEIATYRRVFDDVSEKMELEKKNLENVEKLCENLKPSEVEGVVRL